MRLAGAGLLTAALIVVALGGCGAGATGAHGTGGASGGGGTGGGTAGGTAAASVTVRVRGQVARSCVGPLIAGRPRRCSDRAVFQRGGRRVTVRGSFSVRLRPGRYRVSVDTCSDQQTLVVKRAIVGLRLAPRCPQPL